MRSVRRVVVVVSVAILAVGGGAVSTTVASGATSCGTQLTWTGQDSENFFDAQNWTPQAVPDANSALVIADTPSGAPLVQVGANAQVCAVTFGSAADGGDLSVAPGATLTTPSFHVIGGPAANEYTAVEGDISANAFEVDAGVTRYDNPDANTASRISTNSLTVDSGAFFSLSSSSSNVSVTGTVTLGANAEFDSNSSDSAQLDLSGSLKLLGNVNSTQLELHTTAGSTLDMNGFTWQMRGDYNAVLAGGTTIGSSAPHGVLEVDNQGVLELDGTVTVNSPATLEVANDASGSPGVLSDTRVWTAASSAPTGGNQGVLTGTGTFLWNAGTITGEVTLGPNLNVQAGSSSDKTIDAQNSNYAAVLNNESRHFQLTGGILEEGGAGARLINNGTIVELGGVLGQNSSDAPSIENKPTGLLEVVPSASKNVAWYGSSVLANAGVVQLGLGVRLSMNKFLQAPSGKLVLLIKGKTMHSSLAAKAMTLRGKVALESAAGYAPGPPLTVKKMLTSLNGIYGRASVLSVTHKPDSYWGLGYSAASGKQHPTALNAVLAQKNSVFSDSWSTPS